MAIVAEPQWLQTGATRPRPINAGIDRFWRQNRPPGPLRCEQSAAKSSRENLNLMENSRALTRPYNHLENSDHAKSGPCGQSQSGHVFSKQNAPSARDESLVARTRRREYLSMLMACAMSLRRGEPMTRSAPREGGRGSRACLIEPVGLNRGSARAGAEPRRRRHGKKHGPG
jgi:hypothetical protein